ncbi:hypothetical protein PIB30_083712 [Stylosanthes scabra]|uniref:Uncharacterized protein n=1 Tax=Stylosanthes scabra TaxID=79078 RepID=A0ABU6TSW8_9FABA|nr:hypothetical protein [Stylosanthes scabra]
MASSSSTANIIDEHCFKALFNLNLLEEIVRRKKVTPESVLTLKMKIQTEEEMEQAEQHPYKSSVRGVEVDFSPENIRRVLRFKELQMLKRTTPLAKRWIKG